MFKYINSVILKGEPDDDTSKQSHSNNSNTYSNDTQNVINNNNESDKKRIDTWTQMIFPVYLNYETIEDKLVKDDKFKSDEKSTRKNELNKMDWKSFTPSNLPKININDKNKDVSFSIYPPMDPSKRMEWYKLIPNVSKSDNQQTKS